MCRMIDRYRVAVLLLVATMIWAAPCLAFEFQGFGAVIVQARDNNTQPDPDHGAFQLGQLDFFVSQALGERLDLLTELVIEGDAGEFVVDLERLQIGYLINNLLTFRAGRFHTPLGYWNATFHHGFHLQTAIERPIFIEFEDDGGLLPVHLIGLQATGYQALGSIILQYDAMVGNGSKVEDAGGADAGLAPNSVTDNDARKAFAYRLEVRPSRFPNVGVGQSGYIDTVEIFNTGLALTGDVRQLILGVDLFYAHAPLEVIGEYYYVRNSQRFVTSPQQGTFRNSLFFIQGGYTLFERLTPYFRYEQMEIRESEDPYFLALGVTDTRKAVGGLRYDITYQSAVKFEARNIDPKGRDDFQEYAAQWTVAF